MFVVQVQTLHNINKYSDNLQSLHIGNSVQVLPNYLQPEGTFSDSDSDVGLDGNIYEKQGYVIKCPRLRKLCIRDLFVNRGPLYFDLLLKPLQGRIHQYRKVAWCYNYDEIFRTHSSGFIWGIPQGGDGELWLASISSQTDVSHSSQYTRYGLEV